MASEQPSSSKPTPSDIISALSITALCISPSGSHIIYSTKPYGKVGKTPLSALWVAEPGKAKSARQLTSGHYNDRSPKWSPDGESIAFLSNRAQEEACAIYLLNLQTPGGEPMPLTDAKDRKSISNLEWSRDGKFIGYLNADETHEDDEKRKEDRKDWNVLDDNDRRPYQRLRVVDIDKRKTRTLLKGDYHVAAFSWSPDGNEMVLLTQERPGPECAYGKGQTFQRVSVEDGSMKEIVHWPGQAGSTAGVSWVANDEVWFIAKYPAEALESSSVVYRLSFAQKKCARQACGKVDCARDLRAHLPSGTIYANRDYKLDDEISVVTSEGLAKIYGGAHDISSWDAHKTENGHLVAYTYSNPWTPPEVFTYDSTTRESTQLSSHAAEVFLASKDNNSAHQIICKTASAPSHSDSSDSQSYELCGLLAAPQPQSDSPKARPTVVLVHGGPYANQKVSFLCPHRPWPPGLLATGKYNLLLPNYRGGSGQGRAFSSTIKAAAGTVDYDDCLAMVDEGIAQGWIDKDNIVFAGWSWGGMLAYLAAVRNGTDSHGREKGWRFKGAVAGAGACDGDMMAMLSDLYTTRKVVMGALPWTSKSDDLTARRCSAIWHLSKAVEEKRVPPVLILHGAADPRVVPENAHAFKRALDYYGLDCEAVLYPREEHSIVERNSNIDMLERLLAFCERVLDT